MIGLKDVYVHEIKTILDEVLSYENEVIDTVGVLVGKSIMEGSVIHLFGSGHSDLIARDVHQRAGGLACVNRIYDPTFGFAERITGFGEAMIGLYDLREKEVIIVISNSGRNSSPIEVALSAKKIGLTVVAITSLKHSKQVVSRHPSGKRLYEIADYVIDNHGVKGDAIVSIPGESEKIGATSTIVGSMILNMILIRAAEHCAEKGYSVPIIASQNLDNTDEQNRFLWKKYKNRLGTII